MRLRIIDAIKANDIEVLKELKAELGRNQWLEAWHKSGVGMAGWLEPHPFVQFK